MLILKKRLPSFQNTPDPYRLVPNPDIPSTEIDEDTGMLRWMIRTNWVRWNSLTPEQQARVRG